MGWDPKIPIKTHSSVAEQPSNKRQVGGSIPSGSIRPEQDAKLLVISKLAQRKRAWLITRRSEDRNLHLLSEGAQQHTFPDL
jgi:hypothetical protein